MNKNEQYYIASLLINWAINKAREFPSSDNLQQLYRYSKVVDYSEKGFDCSNAKAIIKLLESNNYNDLLQDLNNFLDHSKIDKIYNKMDDD